MEFVDRIFRNPAYNEYLRLNAEAEKDRQFCIHNLQHALDVARIAYIIALERKLTIDKEIIYVTALLHDIAKWRQYEAGVDHAAEGAVLAAAILEDIGIGKQDEELILDAIRSHRWKGNKRDSRSLLGDLIYDSDKASRLCIRCPEICECNWYADGSKPSFKY